MIDKLFTWDGWDQHDTMLFTFYNCVLLKDICSFKKGTLVPVINVDYEHGFLEFCGNEGLVLQKLNIELNITEQSC